MDIESHVPELPSWSTLIRSPRAWFVMRTKVREFRLDYFRHDDWHLEFDGTPIARLSDARYADHFWNTYAIRVLENRGAVDKYLACEGEGSVDHFKVRHVKTRLIAEYAIPSMIYLKPDERAKAFADGRVMMRGVYASIPPITWYERRILMHENDKL